MYILHFTLYTLQFRFYIPHFTIHIVHFTVHNLHSTCYMSHYIFIFWHNMISKCEFLHSTWCVLHSARLAQNGETTRCRNRSGLSVFFSKYVPYEVWGRVLKITQSCSKLLEIGGCIILPHLVSRFEWKLCTYGSIEV